MTPIDLECFLWFLVGFLIGIGIGLPIVYIAYELSDS